MSTPCPAPQRWQEHLDGSLPAPEQAELTAHLDRCAACRLTLEALAAGSDSVMDAARQAQDDVPPAPALAEVVKQWQTPPSATLGSPAPAGEAALSFLAPSDKPGCLGRLAHY